MSDRNVLVMGLRYMLSSILPVLNKLLERAELSVRLAVGVGVALLFELAREGAGGEDSEDVLESGDSGQSYSLIEQLATESNRHTSRRDRNQTRSCFRDILLSLDVSTETVCVYRPVEA